VDVVFGKLPAFVFVAQEVTNNGEDGTGDLHGYVPSRAYDLDSVSLSSLVFSSAEQSYPQDHSYGEDDSPRKPLHQDVYP
jgi:hypothetical protein